MTRFDHFSIGVLRGHFVCVHFFFPRSNKTNQLVSPIQVQIHVVTMNVVSRLVAVALSPLVVGSRKSGRLFLKRRVYVSRATPFAVNKSTLEERTGRVEFCTVAAGALAGRGTKPEIHHNHHPRHRSWSHGEHARELFVAST